MSSAFVRTAMLVGEEGIEELGRKRVAVFGIGGVGGYVCEALARAGVGTLDLFDDDVVSESNLNRQIVALHSTLGQSKVEVMACRIADINPACRVNGHKTFYLPENAALYPLQNYHYVVDAVDTVSAKLEIITRARAAGVPVISSMGAGNKLHPECFQVADIQKTSICPLARIMRKELRRRGVNGVKVVYSTEPPRTPAPLAPGAATAEMQARPGSPKKTTPGSTSFVPAAAGLVLGGQVIRVLLGLV
ncbi:MAG: ThiF family adenylyltransferase [Oscillospiraceae bacterium]